MPDRIPWSQIHKDTFEKMKKALSDATDNYLTTIDWSKDFNMYTDVGNHSISGVLAQSDSKGNDRPISFFSKKLNATQTNWPVIEREAYAVLTALNRFKLWIFGYHIYAFLDHNPLSYLTESTPESPRLLRWALALQCYNVTFCYKSGTSKVMASPDCLSRIVEDDKISPDSADLERSR